MLATIPQQNLLDLPDPTTFLAENHVGFVVNTESLRQIEGHFNPLQFDPVKVAWVQHDGGRVLRIIDGFTRTQFLALHGGEIRKEHPAFRFAAIDVTAGLLANPVIAEPGADQRDSLLPIEYLRAVIPPTVVHAAIVNRRLAAYIALTWDDLVGELLARQFPAIAALWHFDSHEYETRKRGPFFSGETEEEHELIEGTLMQIRRLIPQNIITAGRNLRLGFVLFTLIARRDLAIGGAEGAVNQIYGLLFAEETTRKIRQELKRRPDQSEAALRAELTQLIASRLDSGITTVLPRMLQDSRLSYADLSKFLREKRPTASYEYWRSQHDPPPPPPRVTPPPVIPPQLERLLRSIPIVAPAPLSEPAQPTPPVVVFPPDPQVPQVPPGGSGAGEKVRSACWTIIQEAPKLTGRPIDAFLGQRIGEALQVLGQLCYGVPDLPLLIEKYIQLDQKYTRLLEQYTARGS